MQLICDHVASVHTKWRPFATAQTANKLTRCIKISSFTEHSPFPQEPLLTCAKVPISCRLAAASPAASVTTSPRSLKCSSVGSTIPPSAASPPAVGSERRRKAPTYACPLRAPGLQGLLETTFASKATPRDMGSWDLNTLTIQRQTYVGRGRCTRSATCAAIAAIPRRGSPLSWG